jgi:type IV pilus assembly protein PilO
MEDYDIKDIFNLPLRVQLTVVAIFCLLIFYLGYQWDISSLKKELHSVQSQETDLKSQLQALIDNLNTVNSDIAQLPMLQALLKQWQTGLVTTETLPDTLNEILKMGTANQLQFQIFTPSSEIKDDAYPAYRRIPINTVVIGEYDQIANFVSQVANMSTLVVISNFELIRGQNKLYDKKEAAEPGYADRLTSAMTLEVYSLAETVTKTEKGPNAK